jgi:membrane protein implicated in regulation of membrane protease activity
MLLNFFLVAREDTIFQIVIFLFATALWALILWKPIQKLKLAKSKGSYHNIIGETASVSAKGLNKKDGGEVIWSGAVMKARLMEGAGVENLEPGAQVEIKDIVGNTLIVIPKP